MYATNNLANRNTSEQNRKAMDLTLFFKSLEIILLGVLPSAKQF
jgi:hypothetical protein